MFKFIQKIQIRTALLALAVCLLVMCFAKVESASLSGNQKQGQYAVGFKVIYTLDNSRPYKDRQKRPMQVAIWYPTSATSPKMEYADYLSLYLTKEDFTPPSEKQQQDNVKVWEQRFAGRSSSPEKIADFFRAKTNVVKDASIAKGSFPVIVYGAGSGGEAFENNILCEYLASYGYIVLASPSVGAVARQTTIDAVGLEVAAHDMEFLIAHAKTFPEADLSKLGVMGWSWGGLAAMLVQLRNPNVDAVVSLDGSIAMHEDKLVKTGFADFDKIRVPVMYMASQSMTPRVKSFVEKVNYSNSFVLDFIELRHPDFISYNFMVRNFANSLDDSERKKQQSYELICQFSLRFFDAQLKGDLAGKSFIENDSIRKDLLFVTRKSSL